MTQHTAANAPGRGTGIVLLLLSAACALALAPAATRAAEQAACAGSAPGRQLDYWVGDWVVTNPGGTGTRRSTRETLAAETHSCRAMKRPVRRWRRSALIWATSSPLSWRGLHRGRQDRSSSPAGPCERYRRSHFLRVVSDTPIA